MRNLDIADTRDKLFDLREDRRAGALDRRRRSRTCPESGMELRPDRTPDPRQSRRSLGRVPNLDLSTSLPEFVSSHPTAR